MDGRNLLLDVKRRHAHEENSCT